MNETRFKELMKGVVYVAYFVEQTSLELWGFAKNADDEFLQTISTDLRTMSENLFFQVKDLVGDEMLGSIMREQITGVTDGSVNPTV